MKLQRKQKREQKKRDKEYEKQQIQYKKDCKARIEKERIEKTGDEMLYVYEKSMGTVINNPFHWRHKPKKWSEGNLEEYNKEWEERNKEYSKLTSIQRWKKDNSTIDPTQENLRELYPDAPDFQRGYRRNGFNGVHPFKPSAWKQN